MQLVAPRPHVTHRHLSRIQNVDDNFILLALGHNMIGFSVKTKVSGSSSNRYKSQQPSSLVREDVLR